MTIYYMCKDDNSPSGGRRVLYRHVEILNKNGIDAKIMHFVEGFRMTWFDSANVPVTYINKADLMDDDILVIPETWGPEIHKLVPGIRKVIFNQNAYYTFSGYTGQETETPYRSSDVIGVMCVSEDSKRYIEYAFPGLKVDRIKISIDPMFEYSTTEKENLVTYMPRKHADEAQQVLNILKWRGDLDGWKVQAIDGMSKSEVAETLKRSKIFLSFGYPEGCPVPPLEALACGNIVVGYTGFGADEYCEEVLRFYVVENSNVFKIAVVVSGILNTIEMRNPIKKDSEKIRSIYSPAEEERTVMEFWRNKLSC